MYESRQSIPSLNSMIEAILRKRGSARHLRRATSIVTAGVDLARSSCTSRAGDRADRPANAAGRRVERGERRVHQWHVRPHRERAGEGDARPLSAGELCGKPRSRCRAMHPARRRAQSSHWPGRRQGSNRASWNTSAIVQSKRGGARRIMLGSLAGKDFRERLPIEEIYAERRERAGAEQDRCVDGVGPSDPGRDDWRQNEKGAIVHRFR